MKALKLSVALGLLFVSSLALATPPKTTLTVERIVIVGNGTSNGKSIASYTFVKRFYTEADCNAEKGIEEAINEFKVGAAQLKTDVYTRAECDAIDHRFTFAPAGY